MSYPTKNGVLTKKKPASKYNIRGNQSKTSGKAHDVCFYTYNLLYDLTFRIEQLITNIVIGGGNIFARFIPERFSFTLKRNGFPIGCGFRTTYYKSSFFVCATFPHYQ